MHEKQPKVGARRAASLLGAVYLALSMPGAAAQAAPMPADTVDAFHAALRSRDSARALSLLDRSLVVYESGRVDPTPESYASGHLASDMDFAVASNWRLLERRVGGEGDERWVLTAYQISGKHSDGTPIEQRTLETAILRRSEGAFRIVHLHWSTRDRPSRARGHTHQQPPQKRP
jgi:ketosteroid isomerase-like protein